MIPMSPDVKLLVGEVAESVDNRSLLYEKFSLPKVWGHTRKVDDAGRWSVLRIVARGNELLVQDAANLERRAGGKNVQPDNAARMRGEAQIARKLSVIPKPDFSLVRSANDNAHRLLRELQRSEPRQVIAFEAALGGRLLVNMAGGVIENAGICLDRCFGLPFIPGSAVKGIARSQALWEIRVAPVDEKQKLVTLAMAVFGYGKSDTGKNGDWTWAAGEQLARRVAASLKADEFKGCGCFLPAYPTTAPTIVVDMVNPHYPQYYRGQRQRATDDENPIPNYFPAVEAGSAFGFAVLLNRVPTGYTAPQLLEAARGWIERAITQKGAGAKTAAGYGWFRLGAPTPASAPTSPPAQPATVAQPPPSFTVNEATLKNYLTSLINPGSRDSKLASLKADLARDDSFAQRMAVALAKQGKDGKKAVEWLKTKGVSLT